MKKCILPLLICLFISFYSVSQEKWTCYTDDKVLLMDDYNTIGVFEYTDGSIWMITSRGINIFDGKTWKKIDNRSNDMNRSIYSYLVDSKNRIWVGSSKDVYYGPVFFHKYNDGIAMYDGKEWTSMRTKDLGFKAPVVTKIYEASNGDIWLGVSSKAPGYERGDIFARGAILRYSNEEWTVYKEKDLPCLGCQFVKGFYEDSNNRLYLYSGNGLFYFEDEKFHRVGKDDGYNITDRTINVRFEDSKKNLWLAAPARIAMFNGKQWKTYNRKNGLPERSWWPLGLVETKNNQMILSMSNGVYYLDENDQWERSKKQFLSGGTYIDTQNRLWIPTHKGLIIKEGESSTIDKNIKKVWSVIKDDAGGEWALSRNDGVKRLKNGQWQTFDKDNQLPSNRIISGYVADDGKVWIATNKGICSCSYN
jgi:ligand-binding sensor domain-containing protein